jgi:hypothetical protein
MTKVKVTAVQPFSHGNVVAAQGGTYEMNKGDAQELEKAGFVTLDADGDAEQTQVDQPRMKPQPGDVVADDNAEILGAKMDEAVDNKMANAAENKRKGK